MATTGEITAKEFTFLWKINDFFSLTEETYFSSSFTFANETWCLILFPNGNSHDESHKNGYVSVYLCRCSSGAPLKISFSISLKTVDKKRFSEAHKECIFTDDDPIIKFSNFLLRSELLEKKSELLPSDTLTTVCSLKCAESTEDTIEEISPVLPELPQGSKILQDLKELYRKQEETDVIIRVKDQELRAHKAILVARSPVLASTFRTEMIEKLSGVIDIKDCDPHIFSEFLSFLYCEEIENLSSKNVFNLFTLADRYDVIDLRTKCLQFIKDNLSKDTFCDTITLALKYTERELLKLSTDFFIQNAQDIILSVEWQSFIGENPIQGNELFVKYMASQRRPDA